MTIDWLDLTCPCCGSMTLISIRQLTGAPGSLECEACGGSFGRRPRGGGTTRPEPALSAAQDPQADLP